MTRLRFAASTLALDDMGVTPKLNAFETRAPERPLYLWIFHEHVPYKSRHEDSPPSAE